MRMQGPPTSTIDDLSILDIQILIDKITDNTWGFLMEAPREKRSKGLRGCPELQDCKSDNESDSGSSVQDSMSHSGSSIDSHLVRWVVGDCVCVQWGGGRGGQDPM